MKILEDLEKIIIYNSFLDLNFECFLKKECSYCRKGNNTKFFLCYGSWNGQRCFRNAHEKCVSRFYSERKELSIQDIFTLQLLCNIQK